MQYEGKNSQGDAFFISKEKVIRPDQLALISRELTEQLKITEVTGKEKKKTSEKIEMRNGNEIDPFGKSMKMN